MIFRMNDARRATVLAAALIISAAATAGAQANTSVPQWDAWIGCWKPAVPAATGAVTTPAGSRPTVCVSRTNVSSAVEVATTQNGAVVTRDTIDANGQQRPVSAQGCTGWERAQWSADAHRVYVRSEVTCADKIKRVGTGILAISPTGQWLDIQGIAAGGNSGVRVTQYTDALLDSLPTIAGARSTRQLATNGARTAAGGALDIPAIVEAVKMVDTAVVQAWIVERGARFTLDAKHLVSLADAGVPGSVTDVMVGVSYPKHFALDQSVRSALGGESELSPFDSARIVSQYLPQRCFGGVDPYRYTVGIYDPCGSRYGYRGYGYGYGYSGYGYGYGRGYSNFGYAGYYGAPVVIVRGDQTQQHGKVIKGVGYTSGSSRGSTSSGASSSKSGGSGSSSSGSSGTSRSSGSSSSGSSGGRTAHPRPPA